MNLSVQQQKISQKATKLQMQASNPESSVWVSASAGTGKTHVLTQRILRLLLNDPFLKISEVLAITFTKAAAMEMQNRLISELAKWVKLDEIELKDELEFLLERKPTLKDIVNARTLLTKVIDDSIGLNISTIHSFCETLLRKFPLEAGIPSSFTLIEERQERKLLRKAWFKAIKQQFDTNKDLFSEVLGLMGEHSLEDAVSSILNQKNRFYKMMYNHGGLELFTESLKTEFNLKEFDEAALRNRILDFDDVLKGKIIDIFNASSSDKTKKAEKIYNSLNLILQNELSQEELVNAYLDIFLTRKLEPSKAPFSKKIKDLVSFDADEFSYEEITRITDILDEITNLQNYKISKVICVLTDKMFKYYKQEKLDLSYLDFNDLIDYSEKLVNKVEIQDWIRYKLDSKIKHCLIDEAQDTDMQQWNILHGIIAEFYYGTGQHENVRTTFAVGDMKQSIYRFRGANPEVFAKIREELDEKSSAIDHKFNVVGLHTSFRSTQAVLNFVDEVFNESSRKVALDGIDESLHHQVFKYDQAGRVELAPLLTKADLEIDQSESEDYQIPLSAQEKSDKLTLRQLNYKNVANKIIDLFNSAENISPQDIIILLRNRTGMPDLIEQLTKANIPHTGSDEIYLSNSIIVDDLVAFAKFLAFEDDDLSLLQILKSPAFNYNDETLFSYYSDYKKSKEKVNFYRYIKDIESFNNVVSKLSLFKEKANTIRVFDLYKYILNDLELTEKMMASFGGVIPAQQLQVKDTVDEFLRQIESVSQLSVLSFLDWFKKDALKVKKNTANAKDAVRIMTVHGSKGLESNVIFLPDSGLDSVKSSISKEKLLFKKTDNSDTAFIYKTRSTIKPTTLEKNILEKEEKLFFEDDMRLLYVALTRARGHIYVSAIQENNELSDYSWYSILQKVMDYRIDEQSVGYSLEKDGSKVFKTAKLIDVPNSSKPEIENEETEIKLPSWINTKVEKETGITQERASYNMSSVEYIEKLKSSSIISYQYGNVVHKLLEELPKINANEHSDYIDSYLANKKDISNKEELKNKVLSILSKYKELFNLDNSFSEVNIQGFSRNKKITGIVDRISIIEDKVYVIDYKTGQKNNEYILKYKQQLDLYVKVLQNVYKDKKVIPAILWISLGELDTL